jgi:hypothetical protein
LRDGLSDDLDVVIQPMCWRAESPAQVVAAVAESLAEEIL